MGKEGRPVHASWLACVDWRGWTTSQLVFPGRLPNSCWGRKSFLELVPPRVRSLEAYKYTSMISYHLSGMVLTGWKTILSFWGAAYFQGRAVSFGEGKWKVSSSSKDHCKKLEDQGLKKPEMYVGLYIFFTSWTSELISTKNAAWVWFFHLTTLPEFAPPPPHKK